MQKTKVWAMFIMLIIVSIIVLQYCDNDEYNAFVQRKLTEVSEYLSQKYSNANDFKVLGTCLFLHVLID